MFRKINFVLDLRTYFFIKVMTSVAFSFHSSKPVVLPWVLGTEQTFRTRRQKFGGFYIAWFLLYFVQDVKLT